MGTDLGMRDVNRDETKVIIDLGDRGLAGGRNLINWESTEEWSRGGRRGR